MIQAFAYVDERAQDDGVVGAERNVVDEAAINFQAIERELAQLAEAGTADAEIVDGPLDPEGF